jgi:DNA-binding NtrC family response regulator
MHHWPGNVRELKNRIQRAYIMADDQITAECIASEIGETGEIQTPAEASSALQFKVGTRLSEVERRMILATLDDCGGDKKKAADVLGLSLRTLYYRLSTYSEE